MSVSSNRVNMLPMHTPLSQPVRWPADTSEVLTRTEFCTPFTPPGPVAEFKENLGHFYWAENATRFEDLSIAPFHFIQSDVSIDQTPASYFSMCTGSTSLYRKDIIYKREPEMM